MPDSFGKLHIRPQTIRGVKSLDLRDVSWQTHHFCVVLKGHNEMLESHHGSTFSAARLFC